MPDFSLPADGQGVTIQELRPPGRIITLSGRDRPEQPVAVGGEQRVTQTYYPGTKKASVQFHGTKRHPITLRGWFDDPLTQLDGGVQTREALLKGMMEGGNLCRLVWGGVIVCQGRVKGVVVEYHMQQRAKYEITFEVDQDDRIAALTPIPIIVAAADVIAAVRFVANALPVEQVIAGAKILTGVVR